MAISFDLEMASPATADRLAAAFVDGAAGPGVVAAGTTPHDVLGEGVVTRSHLWCRAGVQQPSAVPWPSPTEDSFGVTASCWLFLRVIKDETPLRVQQDEMAWLVAGILGGVEGDAVLHWDHEVAWLMRKGGRLLVSDRDDLWTPERLAYLPHPYERVPLAFTG
ncbi:MAG TPA: SitI3 family protein [Acidimicrobiales bacterium]